MGSKYYCSDCGEIYDSSLLKTDLYSAYDMPCPKAGCNGSIFEVDELMLQTIKILNEKGYTTKFCCSGHYYHSPSSGYLWFEEWVELPNLPKGFSIDKNHYKSTYKDFSIICDEAKFLFEWAVNLPEVDY